MCDDSSAIENTIDRYRYLDLFESSRPATNRHMKQRINKQTLIEIFIVYICIVKSKCQTYNEIRGIENIITNWLDIERKKMHRIYRPKNCIQWFIGKKNKNKTITKNMVRNNCINSDINGRNSPPPPAESEYYRSCCKLFFSSEYRGTEFNNNNIKITVFILN